MLVVSYMLYGANKVQDFKNQKAFDEFCFEVNPLDSPYIMEILEIYKDYYYLFFDDNGNYIEYARILLKNSEVTRIGEALEWNNNYLFTSRKKIENFIEKNL